MGFKEYFDSRKRRKEKLEWLRKEKKECGFAPGSIFEKDSKRWFYSGGGNYYPLDENNVPINLGSTYSAAPIGKKIGYFTPTMWKRHIQNIKARQEEILNVSRGLIY
ncbi:MAG TPA: hypothetical protein VJB11_02220 [archaeon]|nr:hypothetical protein [archaeon]